MTIEEFKTTGKEKSPHNPADYPEQDHDQDLKDSQSDVPKDFEPDKDKIAEDAAVKKAMGSQSPNGLKIAEDLASQGVHGTTSGIQSSVGATESNELAEAVDAGIGIGELIGGAATGNVQMLADGATKTAKGAKILVILLLGLILFFEVIWFMVAHPVSLIKYLMTGEMEFTSEDSQFWQNWIDAQNEIGILEGIKFQYLKAYEEAVLDSDYPQSIKDTILNFENNFENEIQEAISVQWNPTQLATYQSLAEKNGKLFIGDGYNTASNMTDAAVQNFISNSGNKTTTIRNSTVTDKEVTETPEGGGWTTYDIYTETVKTTILSPMKQDISQAIVVSGNKIYSDSTDGLSTEDTVLLYSCASVLASNEIIEKDYASLEELIYTYQNTKELTMNKLDEILDSDNLFICKEPTVVSTRESIKIYHAYTFKYKVEKTCVYSSYMENSSGVRINESSWPTTESHTYNETKYYVETINVTHKATTYRIERRDTENILYKGTTLSLSDIKGGYTGGDTDVESFIAQSIGMAETALSERYDFLFTFDGNKGFDFDGSSGSTGFSDWILPIEESSIYMRIHVTQTFRQYNNHTGIDFILIDSASKNISLDKPVYAVASGTVLTCRYDTNYGNMVEIQHSNGIVSRYAHMNKLANLTVGAEIQQGAQVGTIGETGNFAKGVHLHLSFEDGHGTYKFIDPETILDIPPYAISR